MITNYNGIRVQTVPSYTTLRCFLHLNNGHIVARIRLKKARLIGLSKSPVLTKP